MTTITVQATPWQAFAERWPEIEPLLASAMVCASRRYLPIDILAALVTGNGQGWFIRDGEELRAVLVTKIDQYPRARCCTIFCLAGEGMSDWFDTAETVITDYAIRLGCTQFEAQGRRGWERVLDLDPRAVLYVKEIGALNGANKDGGAMA